MYVINESGTVRHSKIWILQRPLPLTPGSGVLSTLDAVNRLFHKQMHYLWGMEKDAIVSSDITKAPFVKWPNAEVTVRQVVQSFN